MAMLVAVSQDTQEDSVKQVRNILSVVITPEWFGKSCNQSFNFGLKS